MLSNPINWICLLDANASKPWQLIASFPCRLLVMESRYKRHFWCRVLCKYLCSCSGGMPRNQTNHTKANELIKRNHNWNANIIKKRGEKSSLLRELQAQVVLWVFLKWGSFFSNLQVLPDDEQDGKSGPAHLKSQDLMEFQCFVRLKGCNYWPGHNHHSHSTTPTFTRAFGRFQTCSKPNILPPNHCVHPLFLNIC